MVRLLSRSRSESSRLVQNCFQNHLVLSFPNRWARTCLNRMARSIQKDRSFHWILMGHSFHWTQIQRDLMIQTDQSCHLVPTNQSFQKSHLIQMSPMSQNYH